MADAINRLTVFFASVLQEEWFWAIVAIVITLISFIIQMGKENEISRANFIYNISNDFGNNERILRAYEWIEECRRTNRNVSSYPRLNIATHVGVYDEGSEEKPVSFTDIDTYVNHFEVVYIILRSVKINNIDELFQHRFLSFMLNPYVQKEELFACFLPDENDFLLMRKWLMSINARNRFSCEAFIDYMNTYTCGNFELTHEALECTRKHWPVSYRRKVKKYLINYVSYICDPKCLYGYYTFSRKAGEDAKVLRIIRPSTADKEEILALQQRVITAMEKPQWYSPTTEGELDAMLSQPQNYACVQICHGSNVVAFACVILNPTEKQDLYQDLKHYDLPSTKEAHCVLDTVFVDPAYRGYGMQKLLIRVLCSWAATLGKRHIAATIHPQNTFSAENFKANGFRLVTPVPIPKYGSQRNVFTRPLSAKDTKKDADGIYTVYPYV